jgi:hypothetical protein
MGHDKFLRSRKQFCLCSFNAEFYPGGNSVGKACIQKVLAQVGCMAKHYHANNCCFSDKSFHQDITDKGQSITFFGVSTHHQNGIIKNRNKELTLGACTLFLHGMCHWPQMVDTMFWPFAIKAMAKRMNSLHMDNEGNTPELLMYGVDLERIPIKNFHTFFVLFMFWTIACSQQVDAVLQNGNQGQRFGVYLGHSPFHIGSVAQVFNPKTARVSPQYHAIFDDDFTTVSYMERGEVPPNWEELSPLSTKSAMDESMDLALKWMSGQEINVNKDRHLVPIQDRISNPFSIVPYQHGAVVNNLRAEINNDMGAILGIASKGECKHPPLVEPFGKAAAVRPLPLMPRTERVGIRVNLIDDFEAEATNLDSSNQPSNELRMPQRVNLHKLGRHHSKCIAENKSKDQHKAQVTFGSRAKQMLGLFTLVCTVDNYLMPKHQALLTLSFSNSLVCHFEEANKHCNGTLKKFHFVSLLTNTGLNKVFTYHQAFKQDDWCDFITAMEKEILDHKSCGHWDLVHHSAIPVGNNVIKAIWSFKRKCFLDGCLNKHKTRLCAHGGMHR